MQHPSSAQSSPAHQPGNPGATVSPPDPRPARRPAVYAGLTWLTIGLGLGSRRYARHLPALLQKNAGDALWALMVFFLMGLLFRRWSTRRVAAAALAFSFAIEFSQRYHAPWIDALRAHTLGHLVLGSGFNAFDLVCYTVGIGLGAAGEWLATRIRRRSKCPPPLPRP